MKTKMRGLVLIVSASMIAAAFTAAASAGTLSKEELIEKYTTTESMAEWDEVGMIPVSPVTIPVMIDSKDPSHDPGKYIKEMLTKSPDPQWIAEVSEQLASGAIAYRYLYNAWRIGESGKQWFADNAKYENGFWYILLENGTASIVGAEQSAFKDAEIIEIPEKIGGALVSKIENRAFESISIYLPALLEIVLPDTIESIGDGAFSNAFTGQKGKINLPENVKSIGRLAFYNTAQCVSDEWYVVQLPESLEYLGYRAFGYSTTWEPVRTVFDGIRKYEDGNATVYSQMYDWNGIYHVILDMPESLVFSESMGYENDRFGYLISGNRRDEAQTTYQDLFGSWANEALEAPDTDEAVRKQAEDVLAFCEEYDMTRQNSVPKYALNDLEQKAAFLYDEVNLIDMNDVYAHYAEKATEPKPAAIANGSGDADCSGTVDVTDSVLLARYCSEDQDAVLTAEGKANADANGDGALTMDDVSEILQIIAKRK